MISKVSSNLSIRPFYDRQSAGHREPTKTGDGFTEDELNEALDPLTRKWNPEREYDELSIAELVPGPRAVTFMGRVVNLSTVFGRSTKQPKAAGWHYVVLKDDSAAISVCAYIYPSTIECSLTAPRSSYTSLVSSIPSN